MSDYIRKAGLLENELYPFNANVTVLYCNRKYRFGESKRKFWVDVEAVNSRDDENKH